MGSENFIITGNQVASNNQFTGGGNNLFNNIPSNGFIYGRVVEVNSDRSIRYEIIQNNLGLTAVNSPSVTTGLAYSFNPNFTRLPQVNELVLIVKGPSRNIGNPARMYDEIDYYILGPISVQLTVDDNKVPKDIIKTPSNSVNNYKLNEIGI